MKIDHILFPVDFSENSRAVNMEVERLAAHFRSDVTLLHVFEVPTSWYGSGDGPLISGGDFLAYKEAERQRLESYVLYVPEDRIQRISAEGSVAWHIAHWTKENDVDLIVMGTHGRRGLLRLALGSNADLVVRGATMPVMLIRAKSAESTLIKASAA